MSYLNPLVRRRLYCRVYIEVVFTEDGIYYKEDIPDDYGGSEIDAKMPVSLFFGDVNGTILHLDFYDYQDVMDADKVKGGSVKYKLGSQEVKMPKLGDGTTEFEAKIEYITDPVFDGGEQGKLNYFIEESLKERASADNP